MKHHLQEFIGTKMGSAVAAICECGKEFEAKNWDAANVLLQEHVREEFQKLEKEKVNRDG